MALLKRIAALAMTLAIGAGACFSGGLDLPSTAAGGGQDDWLHVEGNKICDVNGNEVWLTGCNWFGYNVGSQVFDGVWSQNMHSMLQQIADHGFNLLRVPMSVQLLLQWKNGDPDPAKPKVNEFCNPELTVEGVEGGTILPSFDIWTKAVEWCKEVGIKIMIDIHCAETASAGHQVNLWYTDKYSTEDWCTALEWVADYYKDDDTIIALDLKNEPHGTADVPNNMAKWDDSTDLNNWKYAAETAGKRVLDINPNLLIMIEGVEVYPKEGYDWTAPKIEWTTMTEYYEHTWWGACFRGVRKDPIDLGSAAYNKQIVYSPHDYGPIVWKQTWFYEGFTQETLMKDCWYDNWAFIYEENIAPLLIGEWGGFIDAKHDPSGSNTAWMTYLRDYMIENRIHHTFWCFNENSGDTGGLVYDNFGKWDEDKYALVKPALWQNADGKFIGLDHAIPLGVNGITVSEYYNGDTPVVTTTTTTTTTKHQETTTTTTTTQINTSTKFGDFNCDGKITISDLVLMARYVAEDTEMEMPSDQGLLNADCYNDSKVNGSDITMLARYLAHLIPESDLGQLITAD